MDAFISRAAHEADAHLPSRRLVCSSELGWRSALVRRYADPPTVEAFQTAPVPELFVVMNERGRYTIGSRGAGRWRQAQYAPGSVGLTAPGRSSILRWRTESDDPMQSVHIFIPASVLTRVVGQVWDVDASRISMPDSLSIDDPVLTATCGALARGLQSDWDDLYADTALEFLTVHLLCRHVGLPSGPVDKSVRERNPDKRVRKAILLMRQQFDQPLTVQRLAHEAAMSPFHFIRCFKAAVGSTPYAYLLKMRLRHARTRLERLDESIGEIAAGCGFTNAAHFAAIFRRDVGISPSEYRRLARRR